MRDRHNKHLNQLIVYRINHSVVSHTIARTSYISAECSPTRVVGFWRHLILLDTL
jgi:hypothetical protein